MKAELDLVWEYSKRWCFSPDFRTDPRTANEYAHDVWGPSLTSWGRAVERVMGPDTIMYWPGDGTCVVGNIMVFLL